MKINPIGMLNIAAVKKLSNVNNYATAPVLKSDMVSFGATNKVKRNVNVPVDKALFVANSLSTSTSGHRAVYGSEDFTPDIVKLLTLGVADYAKEQAKETGKRPTVLIGGDTRKASRESLPLINETLAKQGVDVIYIKDPVPTPLLAMAAKAYDTDLSVLMTASHNPWADGGYNLVTKAAAIAPATVTQEVAKYAVNHAKIGTYMEDKKPTGVVREVYPYDLYKNTLNKRGLINWENIKNSQIEVFYDGLQGSGCKVMPRLLDDYGIAHTEVKSSGQEGPNPTDKNLTMLKNEIKNSAANLKIGIANDGDADRFGVVDENGNFVATNDVLLLVSYHLAQNKGLQGTIIRSQATSKQLDDLAKEYGFEAKETPVGFKYIGEDIIDVRKEGKDILLAGEESGGLTINGHIPEKDGILAVSLIMDLVATEGKPISEILKDVKEKLPTKLALANFSKKLNNDAQKAIIMDRAENIYQSALKGETKLGRNFEIDAQASQAVRENMMHYKKGGDGVKLILTDGSTVLVRKSGTEPLVKCYIEATGDTPKQAEIKKAELESLMQELFIV